MRRLALLMLLAMLSAQISPTFADADSGSPAPAPPQRQLDGTRALLGVLAQEYRSADPTHEANGAGRVRTLALALEAQLASWQSGRAAPSLGEASAEARKLRSALGATSQRLQPWPLPLEVKAATVRMRTQLQRAGLGGAPRARPYAEIDALLADARQAEGADASAGSKLEATARAGEAYALYSAGPGERLRTSDPALATEVDDAFWRDGIALAGKRAATKIDTAATVLGDHTIGKDTVVADAAVIVFREGLEAVLILAAITASFVGERRRLRRPVLFGALLGLGASAVTYAIAQALVNALGDGGLRLQAITGILAIAVLLLVTNWFFHRVYWSEWLGRFHRRRRAIERFDRFGFLSGQLVGFALLGLTSVYREGFETVLFLQNLQVSAGSQATALGIAIGLGGTLAVGFVTFKLERKLPYKKMLIATGVLIGLVLAVMVGTTVHSLQGLGWLPSTATGFDLELWWGQWLGVYATWEGIGAQLLALLVVYGSYALARGLQLRRYKRAPRSEVVSTSAAH
ncbi:MAG TPA: FTR1 family protein [Solirubrobacteraceae bacterium]|jgi:high-affinity iron transporter|nr:FTR1 family protein [Solirubrobacteraceae bacterium]